jgi:hypothetical protein
MNQCTVYVEYRAALLLLVLFVFVTGCGVSKVTDPVTGEKVSVANQALAMAEAGAADCLVKAESMSDKAGSDMVRMVADDRLSETTVALLIQGHNFLNAKAVDRQIDSCLRHVEVIAQQYNMTDRDRMASGARIAVAAIAGGVTYGVANSFAGMIGAGFANAGGTNNWAINGGRIVNMPSNPDVVDTGGIGINVFSDGAPAPNPDPSIPQGGSASISSSGDNGAISGNTTVINTGDNSVTTGAAPFSSQSSSQNGGPASISIPNNSNDQNSLGGDVLEPRTNSEGDF